MAEYLGVSVEEGHVTNSRERDARPLEGYSISPPLHLIPLHGPVFMLLASLSLSLSPPRAPTPSKCALLRNQHALSHADFSRELVLIYLGVSVEEGDVTEAREGDPPQRTIGLSDLYQGRPERVASLATSAISKRRLNP